MNSSGKNSCCMILKTHTESMVIKQWKVVVFVFEMMHMALFSVRYGFKPAFVSKISTCQIWRLMLV